MQTRNMRMPIYPADKDGDFCQRTESHPCQKGSPRLTGRCVD